MSTSSPRHLLFVTVPFGVQGDSVVSVVEHLAAEHGTNGGQATAVVSDNREVVVKNATNVRVNYSSMAPRQYFNRRETLEDIIAGALGMRRRHHGRLFLPAIEAAVEVGPDAVILCESHYGAVSLPYWRDCLPDTPIFLYSHVNLSRSYLRNELRQLARQLNGIIVVSSAMAKRIDSRLGASLRSKVHVLPNGVDTNLFRPTPTADDDRSDGIRVLYAGRVIPEKGIHHLVAAVASASRHSSRTIELSVVGSPTFGPSASLSNYERQLRDEASKAGIAVRWRPFGPREGMPNLFSEADIVVIPSIYPDPYPLVVLEAMACGVPVVSSRAGGLPEAGGDVAVYVDPTDTAAFAQTIIDLANDDDRRRQLGHNGRQRALANSWADRYASLMSILGVRTRSY